MPAQTATTNSMTTTFVVGFRPALDVFAGAGFLKKNKMIKQIRVMFLRWYVATLSICVILLGCSRSDIDDPTLRAWRQWTDSMGTQYQVDLQQVGALAVDSQGKAKGTETISVHCVRDGKFYAITVQEENGDEYVWLKNPRYCCNLKRPAGENTFSMIDMAAAGTPDYRSEAISILKLDPLATLMSGDRLLDYCRIAGVSRLNALSDENVMEFELNLDEATPQKARDSYLDDRLLPKRFLIKSKSAPNVVPGGDWLDSWETQPIAKLTSKELTLPRRRVVATKWARFPGLEFEIPTSFDSWTDEFGDMNWYRNRTIQSVEKPNHPNSGIFYISGYGLPELTKGRGKWSLPWILVGVALVGAVGYWVVPKLSRKGRS